MKKPRDFSCRSEFEKESLTSDSWCDTCNQSDLGLSEPNEYEEDGKIYVEGLCPKCRSVVRTYIVEIEPIKSKNHYEEGA